jgi:hypothetical protein
MVVASAAAGPPLPPAGQGLSIRLGEAAAEELFPAGEPLPAGDPLFLRIVIPRRSIAPAVAPERFDALDALVDAAGRAGWRALLCLTDDEPPIEAGEADRPAVREDWLAFARDVGGRYRGRVDLFQVWDGPDREEGWGGAPSARDYAFVFKSTAVTIRSVAPAARVALGSIRPESAGFLRDLLEHEAGPYADAVAIDGSPAAVPDADLESIRSALVSRDAARPIWFAAVPAGAPVLEAFASGAGRGAGLVLFQGGPGAAPAVRSLHRWFGAAAAPMPGPPPAFRRPSGEAEPVEAHQFLDADAFRVLVVYRSPAPEATAEVVLDTADVREPRLVDLETGAERPLEVFIPDRRSGTTRIDVPIGGTRLLVYERVAADALRAGREALSVEGTGEPTVEEILARHQEFRAAQEARLQAYLADAQMDLHFQIGAGRSLDVTFRNRFLYQRGRGAEWEQQEMLVNGVRWKGKRIPRLPFVEPDKVVILPLDIHLDRRYRYRLVGADEADGHACWKIDFEPEQAGAPLYKGTVWIDKRTYARVRMSVLQKGLAAPFLSNDETNVYRPVPGPDGTEHWVLVRLEGSQLYSVSGRSFVVNREVTFSGFRINPDDFAERQQEAYRSDHPILRDTDEGFRYLRRTPAGDRVVEERMPRDQLFWLGGVFYDASVDFPVPLAGVNYFNFDLKGSGAQVNVFFAGALLFFNVTDPALFGAPVEIGADAYGQAFHVTDRVYQDGEEIEGERVDRRSQWLRPFLAVPIGGFWKALAAYEIAWEQYGRDDDTATEFVVPADTPVGTASLGLNWNRWAWSFAAWAAASRRQDWEAWGTPDQVASFDPGTRDYTKWSATLAKEIFLPAFQKVRLQAQWADGGDLDRFSQFQFGFFEDERLRGFSGSGIRFDRGGILRAQYAFDVFEKVRFAAGIDHARVREEGSGTTSHTGFGLSGSFMGPWGTILTFDWGIALHSDVSSAEGEQEIQFFFLKLF